MTKGFIYIIFNECFNYYGPNVYKLGKSIDIQRRLNSYTTSYIKPVELKYLSKEVKNYTLAEQEVFSILKDDRIERNREFFKLDNMKQTIYKIEDVIETINLMSNEEIELKLEQNRNERKLYLTADKRRTNIDDVDIIIELLKSDTTNEKVKILREFEKIYKIARFDINLENLKKVKTIDDNLINKYLKAFESTKTKPQTKEELNKLYVGFLRTFMNDIKLLESKKIRIGKTTKWKYYFNTETKEKVKQRIEESNLKTSLDETYLKQYFETNQQ